MDFIDFLILLITLTVMGIAFKARSLSLSFAFFHDWFEICFYTRNLSSLPSALKHAIFGIHPSSHLNRSRSGPACYRRLYPGSWNSSYQARSGYSNNVRRRPNTPTKKLYFEDDKPSKTTITSSTKDQKQPTITTPPTEDQKQPTITITAPENQKKTTTTSTLSALAPAFIPSATYASILTSALAQEEPKTQNQAKTSQTGFSINPSNEYRDRSPLYGTSLSLDADCSNCWKTHEAFSCYHRLQHLPLKARNRKISLTQEQAFYVTLALQGFTQQQPQQPSNQDIIEDIHNQFKKIFLKYKPLLASQTSQKPASPAPSFIFNAQARNVVSPLSIRPLKPGSVSNPVSPLKPQEKSPLKTPKLVLSGSPVEPSLRSSPAKKNINQIFRELDSY